MSSTSRPGEQRSSGTREVVRATSASSEPPTRAVARLEISAHSPTAATLGDHVRELAHEKPTSVRPSGGSEPRGGSPSGGSGVRVAPKVDQTATRSGRRSGGKDVCVGSPPTRHPTPIHVASESKSPSPPSMVLPPGVLFFRAVRAGKQRSGCSNSLRRLRLPARRQLTRWVMGPTLRRNVRRRGRAFPAASKEEEEEKGGEGSRSDSRRSGRR